MTKQPDVLKKYGMTFEEALTNPALLNNALTAALNIDNPELTVKCPMPREDKGIVIYYKLAFKLFGYKIEGFFYLYFWLYHFQSS